MSLGNANTVSGVTSSGQTISSGNNVIVESGGVTISYTVLSGGTETVDNGGTASATTLSNGGAEFVYSGGTAIGTMVSSGGAQYVYSGTASGTIVSSGGFEFVSNGGTTTGTTVSKGGVEFVYSGGTASGVTDEAGGFVVALPGANVTVTGGTGTVVSTGVFYESAGAPGYATAVSGLSLDGSRSSDLVYVLQSGTTTATSLAGGAIEYIYSGGTASGTTVSSGSDEFVSSGGTAIDAAVSSGGFQYVYSGGTASGTTVSSGGREYDDGTASGTTVSSGGTEFVSYGGKASGTTVSSGGAEIVSSGGTTTGTTVSSGGTEFVSYGGKASSTAISRDGVEDVYSGGLASGTTVSSGGAEFVYSGGTTTGTTVSSGGVEVVYGDGTARGVNVAAGGFVVAVPGANVTSVTGAGTVVSTGVFYDDAGTPGYATAVSSLSLDGSGFSDQVDVLRSGTTTGTSLAGGAVETVFSGGRASGTIVSNGSEELISSGGTAVGATVSNGGVEDVYSGGKASGIIVSSGGVELIAGGTATSTTFAPGGQLDLRTIAFGSGETASISRSALLTVTSGGKTVYSQQLAAADADDTANVTSAPDGDTLVTVTCFASGTAIRTTRGDVAVEALAVGDVAVTASGARRRIRWIGHRTIDCRNHPSPNDVRPVRIAAHSFGADLPERDLYLSPGHPVLIGADDDGASGHLVPIMCLVNGTTVRRIAVDAVTYWHVELDAHDILLAEGLPAESYLDWGDRGFFTEGADHRLVNPDFVVPGLAARCRPVALDGPIVEAERRRLDTVFASRLAAACDWPAEHDAVALL